MSLDDEEIGSQKPMFPLFNDKPLFGLVGLKVGIKFDTLESYSKKL